MLGPTLLAVALSTLVAPAALAAPQGYVDAPACRPCHQEIFDAYQKTPMGRSFYLPNQAPQIEDWQSENRYYHQPSERYYEMTSRPEGLFVRRYQLDSAGNQVRALDRRVTHIMGSGERARSYLHQSPDGRIIELPVSWYSQENRWAMAPGYDRPKHAGFTRQVNHKCMFCHNGYPDVPPETARTGWNSDVTFPAELPLGIDCQRCHGAGQQHVSAAQSGATAAQIREAIVHPAKLSPERQMDICQQCHLETTTFRLPDSYRRFGRSTYSFQPGEPLGDYVVHFDHAPGSGREEKFEIVSAAYRLRQSRCFLESSGALLCTTCHDPHQTVAPTDRVAHNRESCLGCHKSGDNHPPQAETYARSNCVACHMPLRRTEDVVHVAMTDHKIQRLPPPGDHLAPLAEKTDKQQAYQGEVAWYFPDPPPTNLRRDVLLGIAQVKEKANLIPGVEMLQKALEARPEPYPEPYFELAEALAAAGRPDEAVSSYRQAIENDARFPHARNNLANLLLDLNRPKEAIEQYRAALEITPDSADIWNNLGLAYRDQGNIEAAADAFRRAIQANPLWADAHLNLGSLLLTQGAIDGAERSLKTALAIEPAEARAHFNLGLLRQARGEFDAARESYQNAVKWGDKELAGLAAQRLEVLAR